MEQFKTYFLMTGLMLLFIFFGGMLAGQAGMLIAFVVAGGMNFYAYYYSDTQVLAHYHAMPVSRNDARGLYEIVERLTQRASLPMPKLYIIPDNQPNAFATGRDYDHAVVAVTEGLLDLMSHQEVEAVIAHELSHIKHYDMLIGTVTATMAGAIAMLAQFGGMIGNSRERPNMLVTLALIFLMPLVATIIQMTVSRNREYLADEGSAKMTGNPQWLQSALRKLDSYARGTIMRDATPQTAHLFIINPFTSSKEVLQQLFSTHPSTEKRIARLEEMRRS
jgi:heat shock protein HtpX